MEGHTTLEIDSAATILQSIHHDLDEREAKAKAIQADIERRNDELDRKAAEVELLSRKYNTLVASQGSTQHSGASGTATVRGGGRTAVIGSSIAAVVEVTVINIAMVITITISILNSIVVVLGPTVVVIIFVAVVVVTVVNILLPLSWMMSCCHHGIPPAVCQWQPVAAGAAMCQSADELAVTSLYIVWDDSGITLKCDQDTIVMDNINGINAITSIADPAVIAKRAHHQATNAAVWCHS